MFESQEISEEDYVKCLTEKGYLEKLLDECSESVGYPWRVYDAHHLKLGFGGKSFHLEWRHFDFERKWDTIKLEDTCILNMHLFKYLEWKYRNKTNIPNVIGHIPYHQVIKKNGDVINKDYYSLTYSYGNTSTSINSFNRKILEKIQKCMSVYNNGFEKYSLEFSKKIVLYPLIEEEVINKSISYAYTKTQIEENSKGKDYLLKNKNYVSNKARRKSEYIRRLNQCPICRGGGGPCCEPYRYI